MQNFLFPLESRAKIVTYSTTDKDMLIFYILFLEKSIKYKAKDPKMHGTNIRCYQVYFTCKVLNSSKYIDHPNHHVGQEQFSFSFYR